ncbi:MAG: hypothetical protein LBE38_02190 [Deltaproteobacteria bacterium]|jgi:epoxyqueuosine reductase QueG|nr:hypothetical protein [Deltaproteobacteria bacterium]
MTSNKWKYLYFGLGFAAGLSAASLFSGKPSMIRNAATSVVSYGLSLKHKIEKAAELMKEGVGDLVAESEEKREEREERGELKSKKGCELKDAVPSKKDIN